MPPHSTPLSAVSTLLEDRTIGPATKLAYLALWDYCGWQPGRVTVTAEWLGQTCGRSARVAHDWLSELKAHGLVTIGERTKRRGAIEVYVYGPHPATQPRPGDPQARLSLSPDTPGQETPAGVAAQQPPPDENPRGGFCAATPAGKTASNAGNSGVAAGAAGVSAQQPPRHAVCVNEFKELKFFELPKYQRIPNEFNEFNEFIETPPPVELVPIGDGVQIALPRAIGPGLVAAALDRCGQRTAPAAQKLKLKQRIRTLVGTDGLENGPAEYVVGAAADMVLFGGVPECDLDLILRDVAAMRGAGTLRNAAAFFHAQARKLAARHGFKWPGKGPRQDKQDQEEGA